MGVCTYAYLCRDSTEYGECKTLYSCIREQEMKSEMYRVRRVIVPFASSRARCLYTDYTAQTRTRCSMGCDGLSPTSQGAKGPSTKDYQGGGV